MTATDKNRNGDAVDVDIHVDWLQIAPFW